MDIKMRIPASVDLTKEKGWQQDDRDKYLYFIARLNLHIKQYQDEATPIWFGDIITPFRTTEKSETDILGVYETKWTSTSIEETTRAAVMENEFVSSIGSEIAAGVEIPSYQVSSRVAASYEERIKRGLSASFKESAAVMKEETRRFEIRQKVEKGAKELQVAVAGYKKYRREVYLHYIDYLFVEYRTTTLGLRKKKTNMPRPEGASHANRIKMNVPLFRISYYELEPKSSLLFTESEYKKLRDRVTNPDSVVVEELKKSINLPLPVRPERPTLYTLSNLAFPLRWIDRKGDWTREELMQLELEEARGSAWWFEYGPGRKQGGG